MPDGYRAGLALGVRTSQGAPPLGTRSQQFPRLSSSLAGGGGWARPLPGLYLHWGTGWFPHPRCCPEEAGAGSSPEPREELAEELPSLGGPAARGSGPQELEGALNYVPQRSKPSPPSLRARKVFAGAILDGGGGEPVTSAPGGRGSPGHRPTGRCGDGGHQPSPAVSHGGALAARPADAPHPTPATRGIAKQLGPPVTIGLLRMRPDIGHSSRGCSLSVWSRLVTPTWPGVEPVLELPGIAGCRASAPIGPAFSLHPSLPGSGPRSPVEGPGGRG